MGKVIVEVNGIVVGSVSADELCQMKDEVGKDPRTWVNQTLNYFGFLFKLGKISLNILVVGVVAGALFLALNKPATFSDMLRTMTTTPEIVKANVLIVWQVWIVSLTFVFIAFFKSGSWKSLSYDYFAEGLATKLRKKLNVPAIGEVRWYYSDSYVDAVDDGSVQHTEILLGIR